MNLTKNKINIIYFISYVSLLIGFYFNEDFALGYIQDYSFHKKFIDQHFNLSILDGLLNYDEEPMPHSPIFIIYLISLKNIFNSEIIARLINLHLYLLLPFFLVKSLKVKYNLNSSNILNLAPVIVFFSPYFRGGAIWSDDNVSAVVLFTISIYFFLKYEKDSKKNISNIFLNTLFLSLSAYFRPIFAIFSLYFLIRYFLDSKFTKKFYYYILFNLLLSFPAFYYVFVLDVNEWITRFSFRGNSLSDFHTYSLTQLSLSFSVIFFYMFPFLMFDYKNLKNYFLKVKNLIIYIIIMFLLFLFFEFDKPYSGGIFYKTSNFIFNNNLLFFIIAIVSFGSIFFIFFKDFKNKNKIFDIIILVILILLEIDSIIYHETYDPLIFILVFLILKNKIFINFMNNFNFKKLILLLSFETSFLFFSLLKGFL
jgi:hypothetical protein